MTENKIYGRKDAHAIMKRWNRRVLILPAAVLVAFFAATLLVPTASAHTHPDGGEYIYETPTYQPTVSSWAQEEVKRARELGLIPAHWDWDPRDYRQPITRVDFMELSMLFVALQQRYDIYSLKDLTMQHLAEMVPDENGKVYYNLDSVKQVFADCREASVPYYLGLVQGRGNGVFDPEGLITRQEAAVMLTRAYGVCGGNLPENAGQASFTDEANIAQWAKASASALSAWNVMKGMEDGSFSPDGNYTVEQCLVTLLRLYENAPVSRMRGNVPPLFTYEQDMEDVIGGVDPALPPLVIEGPVATFVRKAPGAYMRSAYSFYFVYRAGGVLPVDFGVCSAPWGLTYGHVMDNPRFSEDGKTFLCTITLAEDALGYLNENTNQYPVLHKKGVYHITVDVETLQYQLEFIPG